MIVVGKSPPSCIEYKSHKHEDSYETVLHLSGHSTAYFAGKQYSIEPGCIYIIPPDMIHSIYDKEGYSDIVFITEQEGELPWVHPDEIFLAEEDSNHTIGSLMQMMWLRYLSTDGNDIILHQIAEVIHSLIKEQSMDVRNVGTRNFDRDVDKIKQSLMANISNADVSITEILNETGYCTDHIRRKFIAETGFTPSQYLTHLRIDYAKKLLMHRIAMSNSISDVAAAAGFYDVAYFSRLFKKETGITPRDWH